MNMDVSTSKRAWTAPKLQRLQVQQAEGDSGSNPGDGGDNKKKS
jgi:hypothetical protein